MKFWPLNKKVKTPAEIQLQDRKAKLDTLKLARDISPYLTVSIAGWSAHEPRLAEETGVAPMALQGSFSSVAFTLAKLLAQHVEIPTRPGKFESFVAKHCDHSFNFPGIPERFVAGPFLSRVTPEEWKSLANDCIRPGWIEDAVVQWAKSQQLKLKAQAA